MYYLQPVNNLYSQKGLQGKRTTYLYFQQFQLLQLLVGFFGLLLRPATQGAPEDGNDVAEDGVEEGADTEGDDGDPLRHQQPRCVGVDYDRRHEQHHHPHQLFQKEEPWR